MRLAFTQPKWAWIAPAHVIWVFATVALALLQQPCAAQLSGSSKDSSIESELPQLPATLPDGRPLRAIGFFQSQVAELVPRDYVPVRIDDLRSAIERFASGTSDDQASRVKSAVYWVDVEGDTLVSQRSVLDLESYRPGMIRRSLGRVNLALTREVTPSSEPYPILISTPDGELEAILDGTSQVNHAIEFPWRLKGRVSGAGHEFSMRLPATPQARMVLSVPTDLSLTAIDGVLRRLTSPPPDAVELRTDRDWYEIDAGGLETVRIRTQQNDPVSEGTNFVVRQSNVQYRAEPSGLLWTCRMVVQPPLNRPFPKMVVRGTTITSAKLNGTDVVFASEVIGDRQQHLELEVPRGIIDSQSLSVDVTLTGYTTWNNRRGWCDLPMPIWTGPQVVYASATDEIELIVSDPLQVAAWKLPETWSESTQYGSDGLVSIFRASGPPIALSNEPNEDGQYLLRSQPNWSRVRFGEYPAGTQSETLLRLEESNEKLSATARLSLTVDPQRVEPLRLIIQPGWSIESIAFGHSGRLVETATLNSSTRYVDLWPESEDVAGDDLRVDVVGNRLIPVASNVSIPSTWFARIDGIRSRVLAAILQPADFNWSGQSTLQRLADPPDLLDDSQVDFFKGADEQTLWFRPLIGRTPRVSLQVPTVAFNTSTFFQVFRDGDDLAETVVVEIESQSQSIKQITVDTGPSSDRPIIRWSISGINDSPATSIASSDIEVGQDDRDGIYTIDLSDQVIRGRRLIGRRRYPIGTSIQLPLPGVPGAASQQSEVHLGPGLRIEEKSRAAQRIPFGAITASEFRQLSSEAATTDLSQVSRLRYDAVEQPSLTLGRAPMDQDVTVVWREQIRMTASSRGSDLIEATYTVSPATDFVIDYEPGLQLASVLRDGVSVDLITLPQRPIVIQSRGKTETIKVRWTRSQFQSSWLRPCRFPQVEASGTILRSDRELVAATDTFVPAALWRGRPGAERSSVAAQSGQSMTLIRRNIALAFGWLVAFIVFAISWRVADRSPIAIAVVVTVLTAVLFLWWPWRLAIIGWLIIPMLAAAILSTTQRWAKHSQPHDSNDGSTASLTTIPDQADFSLGSMARFMIWFLALTNAAVVVIGQESSLEQPSASQPRPAINILVPMTPEGSFYGEMVYISGRIKEELFPVASALPAQEPKIQSARYSLQLSSDVTGPDVESGCALRAEFRIHVPPSEFSSVPVSLPLAPDAVLLIERVDEPGGLIPFRTDLDGQVIATLPSGDSTRVLVTLKPAVSQVEQWTKLFLAVPPVAATRLSVESDVNIDAIRFGGSTGNLLLETDLRRWVDELGPVDSIEIDFRPEATTAQEAKPLQRRYWVNANSNQVAIDCEIDPPTTMAAGEEFQFVLRDSRLPTVTSTDWRLERSEQYSASRRLMTFTSLRDNPGPIRLLWVLPMQLAETGEPGSLRIPDVIAAALGENAPAWIGLQTDPSVQFLPIQNESVEALSVDYFLAAWSGYRGNLDRASVVLADLPTLKLQRAVVTPPAIEQQHDMRITQNRIEHYFTVTLSPDQLSSHRTSIQFPRALQLVEASINGRALDSNALLTGVSKELPLGSLQGEDPITVRLIALGPLGDATQRKITPPSIRLVSNRPLQSQTVCTLYRASSIDVELESQPIASEESVPELTPELLIRDWIPVSRWVRDIEPDTEQEVDDPIALVVRPNVLRFDTSQLISLTQKDNQWSMEVIISFLSDQVSSTSGPQNIGPIPDFVDVEVPTAWCQDLTIEPASLVYAQRAGTDDSRQILRIHCDPSNAGTTQISVSGRLQGGETGLVSVPSVRVLGFGIRRVFIDVPSRLDNEPIQWRTSAVEAIELPEAWEVSDADRSTYVVASPSWSIDLAPLAQEESSAVAFSADAQLFQREDGSLLLCHWDFFPGGLESIRMRLPESVEVIGAWSAGRAVMPSESLGDDGKPRTLDVPLDLGGLSQPIEVLFRLPKNATRPADYLPSLLNVSATRNWLVQYSPSNGQPVASPNLGEDEQLRALALARSVLESVSTVGRTAQRPRDEVAAWLSVWVQRYRLISQSVGRDPNFQEASEILGQSSDEGIESVIAQQSLPIHLQWRALDAELADLLQRRLPDPETPNSDPAMVTMNSTHGSTMFAAGGYSGFVPQQIVSLSATNRPKPLRSISDLDLGLRTLIINLLTLLLVGGLLLCLRSLKTSVLPVVIHPAFWLGLLGIFGLAVAPVAVAGALVMVAVTLPAIPSKR